jgi:two-component system nitrate/nitrite response regulator NarL
MEGARVLVVSGDPDLQRDVRKKLEHGRYSVDVSATASTAEDCVAKGLPDVAFVDLALPELDAVHFVKQLVRRSPSLPVIALAPRGADERVVAALRVGARGCLYVDDLDDRLLAAVSEALGGGSPVSRGMAGLLVGAVRRARPASSQGNLSVRPLSEHELRVLAQLARGFTYEDVACSLGVSINTVRTQVRAIYDKLDVSSRTEAVLLGMRLGLVRGTPFPGAKPR